MLEIFAKVVECPDIYPGKVEVVVTDIPITERAQAGCHFCILCLWKFQHPNDTRIGDIRRQSSIKKDLGGTRPIVTYSRGCTRYLQLAVDEYDEEGSKGMRNKFMVRSTVVYVTAFGGELSLHFTSLAYAFDLTFCEI